MKHNHQQANSEPTLSLKLEAKGNLVILNFCQANVHQGFPKDACTLLVDGEVSDKVMLTDTSQETTVEVLALGTCSLLVVGVGGGGKAFGGAGGSGFVEWHQLNLSSESMTLNVKVGGPGGYGGVGDTTVGDVLTAAQGEDGRGGDGYGRGGDGYSGGGGEGYKNDAGDGGRNGYGGHGGHFVDGGGSSGGRGSYVKVDEIPAYGFAIL